MIHLFEHLLSVGPLLCISFGGGGGHSDSTTTTDTTTATGSGQNVGGGGQAVGAGSIGISGSGAKYQETGSLDQSGAYGNGPSTGSVTAKSGIALGSSSKYLEQGSEDLQGVDVGGIKGSTVNATGGGSVVIGDPNADNLINSLADKFTSTIQSIGTGISSSTPTSTGEPLSYKTIGLVIAAITAIVLLFKFVFGGNKS